MKFEDYAKAAELSAARAGVDLKPVLGQLRMMIAHGIMTDADAVEAMESAHHTLNSGMSDAEGEQYMRDLADTQAARGRS